MSDFNPIKWTPQQWQAAGKHLLSYSAGGVSIAVAWHFISPGQGTDISSNINDVVEGTTQLLKGLAGLLATGAAIYSGLKSAQRASPASQVESVVNSLAGPVSQQVANAIADPTSRDKLIAAVADMPEVMKIVPVDPQKAEEIPSAKVVTS